MKGRERSLAAEFFVALRYLLGRAKEGGRYLRGAAAGVAVSLIPIVVTLMVSDGMIQGITARYMEMGTGHLQVFDFLNTGSLGEAAAKIREMEQVRGVWAERQSLGILVTAAGKTGASIRAIDPGFWVTGGGEDLLTVRAGSAELTDDREILLGEEIASQLQAAPGDTVRIMTLRSNQEGRIIPRFLPFTVKGIVSSGYRELDALWCIMTFSGGETFLPQEMSNSFLMVKIDEPFKGADLFAARLRAELGAGYGVYTWKDLQRSQYSSYESTRQILLLIMALIVAVAAVNVSSATGMLVIERQRDIAVLKAFGASPGSTRGIFVLSALLTGIIGAVAGLAAGLLLGSQVNNLIHGLEKILSFFSHLFNGEDVKILDPGYYLEQIPLIIDWKTVFAIGLLTVVCSVLASFLPARCAARIKPLELLRKY
jgi:lipoprotein-releasing system permease protein